MKILITVAHLAEFAGSELYTVNLTKELSRRGHSVTVYSPVLGKVAESLEVLKRVKLINKLDIVKDIDFDIIHIQHNITAWLVRKYFPNTPAIMVIHGILPKLEQPPKIDLGIYKYVVVSSEIKEHLIRENKVSEKKIEIIYNWVDTDRFSMEKKINNKPKKLLVISNHLEPEQEKIYKKVCQERNIEFIHIGLPEKPVQNVEDYINKVDIVVTLGRGALEAMACGRNVIISDRNGLDGMITPSNYHELIKNNLSGRRYNRPLTEEIFKTELDKYSDAYSQDFLRIIRNYHSAKVAIERLLGLYREARNKDINIDPFYMVPMLELDILMENLSESNYEIRHLQSELERRN